MKDALSVITSATEKIAKSLAADFEVSLSRMYELLSRDCSYPKTKKLIRAIARHNQIGAREIKADMDALWADVLNEEPDTPVTAACLHKESADVVQAFLENKPKAVTAKELRELIATAQKALTDIESD